MEIVLYNWKWIPITIISILLLLIGYLVCIIKLKPKKYIKWISNGLIIIFSGILITIFIIKCLLASKSYIKYIKTNKIKHFNGNLKFVTYNINALPFTGKLYNQQKNYKLVEQFSKFDVVFLQEAFFMPTEMDKNNLSEIFNQAGFNVIMSPTPKFGNLEYFDAGLIIATKFPVINIDFQEYKEAENVDQFTNKGFLVVNTPNFTLINTHNQADYDSENENEKLNGNHQNVRITQYKQITNYIKNNTHQKNILLAGDFNIRNENRKYLKIYNYNNIEVYFYQLDGIITNAKIKNTLVLPLDNGFWDSDHRAITATISTPFSSSSTKS
jgi:exonuclease III